MSGDVRSAHVVDAVEEFVFHFTLNSDCFFVNSSSKFVYLLIRTATLYLRREKPLKSMPAGICNVFSGRRRTASMFNNNNNNKFYLPERNI